MGSATAVRQASDSDLIEQSRAGDAEAYAELYRRHVDSARAAARALTRSRSDAEDVTSEAFARVLRAVRGGGGPQLAFRPYVLAAVRNVFYDRVRRQREQPSSDMDAHLGIHLVHNDDAPERDLAAAALAALPERWQFVLWHTEVEGLGVGEVAGMMGVSPNAAAALAYRAREGLRQAYLQAHLRVQQHAACRACTADLGAYVRDRLSARDRRKVDLHLSGCASCAMLLAEVDATNDTLRSWLVPAATGVSLRAYMRQLRRRSKVGWRLPLAFGAAAATVAAVVVLVPAGHVDRSAPPLVASTTSFVAPFTVPVTTAVPVAPPIPSTTASVATTLDAPAVIVPSSRPRLDVVVRPAATAVRGEAVNVDVVVSNRGSAPAHDVHVTLAALPAGTRLLSETADAAPALAVGAQQTVHLRIAVDPVGPTTFDVSARAGAPGAAAATGLAHIVTTRDPTVLFAEDAHAAVVAIGNGSLTCADSEPTCAAARAGTGAATDHFTHAMQFVADGAGTAFDSSTATLPPNGDVAHAWLTWAGDVDQGGVSAPDAAAVADVLLTGPDAAPRRVHADKLVQAADGTYVAVADVSALVHGAGTYTVADVQTAPGVGSFGGWALIVVVHDPALPQRLVVVTDPLAVVGDGAPWTASALLGAVSAAGTTAVVAAAFAGDMSLAGDTLVVDGNVVRTNAFRGDVPGERAPTDANTLGTDIAVVGGRSATDGTVAIDVTSTDDLVRLAVLAYVIDR